MPKRRQRAAAVSCAPSPWASWPYRDYNLVIWYLLVVRIDGEIGPANDKEDEVGNSFQWGTPRASGSPRVWR